MYDTWNDPYEIRNLANDPGYQRSRETACLAARAREGSSTARSSCPPTARGR